MTNHAAVDPAPTLEEAAAIAVALATQARPAVDASTRRNPAWRRAARAEGVGTADATLGGAR